MEQARKNKHVFVKILLIIFVVILGIFSAIHHVNIINAFANYSHNVTAWEKHNHSGIIYDQGEFEDLKYGFGNISANACGAISVYNILTLENKNPYFPDIIREFDFGGENLFGIAGTKPTRIITLLKKHGFTVNTTFNKRKFKEYAQKNKYAIYLYVGSERGQIFGHYQLMYNFDGEKFDTINTTGQYTYEEIVDIPNLFLSMMIGVNI